MNYFRQKCAGIGTIASTVLGGGFGSWAGNALEQKAGIDKPFERTLGGTYGLVLGSGLGYAGAKGIRLVSNALKNQKNLAKSTLTEESKDIGARLNLESLDLGRKSSLLNQAVDTDLRNINSGYRGSF